MPPPRGSAKAIRGSLIAFLFFFVSPLVLGQSPSAIVQDSLYKADFQLSDGTVQGPGTPPKWVRDTSGTDLSDPDAHAEVQNAAFEAQKIDGEVSLITDTLDPTTSSTGYPGRASIIIDEDDLDAQDSIHFAIKGEGAPWFTYTSIGGSFGKDTVLSPAFTDTVLLKVIFEQSAPNGVQKKQRVEDITVLQKSSYPQVNIDPSGSTYLCEGECVDLTAVPSGFSPNSYYWITPASGIVSAGQTYQACPNVAPFNSVSYGVLAMGSGIPFYAYDNISVQIVPDASISPTVQDDPICLDGEQGDCATIEFEKGALGSYNISPSPTNVNCNYGTCVAEVCPNQTTTYSITVKNWFGCSTTEEVTIDVEDCRCEEFTAEESIGNSVSCQGIQNATCVSNIPWMSGNTINGTEVEVAPGHTLVVDQDLEIIQSRFKMGKDSRILVRPGKTLRILGADTFSHFFSCTELWDGFDVKGDGTLIVEDNSLIEDAFIGIDLTYNAAGPASLTLDNARMNKNFFHVRANPSSGTYPLSITGTEFTSNPLYSPGHKLLAPEDDEISHTGVYLIEAGPDRIQIGDAGGKENLFEGMYFGIRAERTSFLAVNNIFYRIGQKDDLIACGGMDQCPSQHPGRAITSYQDPSYFPPLYLKPQSMEVEILENRFYKNMNDIVLLDPTEAIIQENEIDFAGSPPSGPYDSGPLSPIGNQDGVRIVQSYFDQNSLASSYKVQDNYIANKEGYGVKIKYLQEPVDGELIIQENAITNPDVGSTHYTTNGQHSSVAGIQVLGNDPLPPSTSSGPDWKIVHNDLEDQLRGIQVMNLKGHHLRIADNDIESAPMKESPNAPVLPHIAGIHLQNTAQTRVANNWVEATEGPEATRLPKGITGELSTEQRITCNDVASIGDAFLFYGHNDVTVLGTNRIGNNGNGDTYHQGVVLSNDGYIGWQGNPAWFTSAHASANRWETAPAGGGDQAHTWTQNGSDGSQSRFYVNPGPQAHPTPEPWINLEDINTQDNPINVIPFQSNEPPVAYCPESGGGPLVNEAVRDTMLRRVALDEIDHSYPEGSRWWAVWQAYGVIERASGLPGGDPVFDSFMDSVKQSSIGTLREVDELRWEGEAVDAQTLNSSIPSNSALDSTLKAYNTIQLNSWAIDSPVTAQQEADLTALADKCPITHGPGVYRSRNMLRTLHQDSILRFENDCPVPSDDHNKAREEDDGKSRAEMQPNPAKERTVLNYEFSGDPEGVELVIRDVHGRVLDRLPLRGKQGQRPIDLSGYAHGVLLYELNRDGERLESGKVLHMR